MFRTVSRWLLNTSKEADSACSLGSLYQFLVTLIVKKCFLMLIENLQCFSLCPCSLVLSLGINENSPAPSWLRSPFRYLYTWMRFPLSSILHHVVLQQAPVNKSRGFKYIQSEWMQHEQRLMHAYISSNNNFSWSLRNLAHSRFWIKKKKKNWFLPLYLWLLGNNLLSDSAVLVWIWKQEYKAKSFLC